MKQGELLTKWLSERNTALPALFTSLTAFLTYACMYGIRKPFTASEFTGLTYWGIDYKSILIIAQVVGYSLSKFIGIKVISEMKRHNRFFTIIILTGSAEIALIFFGVISPPYNIIFLFLNGLPLGLIWGLVFAYLEGRRNTEFLGTVLSISFIVSSGFVKSIGKLIAVNFHLSDFEMPWITGVIFYLPLILMAWLLDKTPEPTVDDQLERTRREPMDRSQRKKLFRNNSLGLILLIIGYTLLTIYRDLRDNFAVDIWKSIGYTGSSMIMTWTELPIALFVFAAMTTLMLIRNNQKAFLTNLYFVLSGFAVIGISTAALNAGLINPSFWMVLLGLGTYLGYLPFNCLLFDRFLAATGSVANAGFLIYLADSFGYLASMGTLIVKNFSMFRFSWYDFLKVSSYGTAFFGIAIIFLTTLYFSFKLKSGHPGNHSEIYL